jgi:hypothetical protein
MEKVQQQAASGGDVVMGEAGEGDGVSTNEVKAGTKCSHCTKKGHIALHGRNLLRHL